MGDQTVSIGVPVYNGGDMIEECLTCLAGQTHGDFQVYISDNASTDATSDICAWFAAKDSRFFHHRRKETCDAATNFLEARDASPESELFMWRAHDDLSDSNFLSAMVNLFKAEPEIDLAVSSINSRKFLDGKMVRNRVIAPPKFLTSAIHPAALYSRLMRLHESSLYGLWNRQSLIESFDPMWKIYPHEWASDHLILLPLALKGSIRGDASVRFIQRLKKKPKKAVAPKKNLKLINEQRQLAAYVYDLEVNRRTWSRPQMWALAKLKELYLNKRVHRL